MVESVRKNPTASKKPKKLVKEPPVEPAEPVEHLSVPEEVKNSLEDPHSQDHPSRSSLYGGFLMMDVFK